MTIKIKVIKQFIYSLSIVMCFLLNIAGLYYASYWPRIISCILIIISISIWIQEDILNRLKSIVCLSSLSSIFLFVSILNLYHNDKFLSLNGAWFIIQPTLYMTMGYIYYKSLSKSFRKNTCKAFLVILTILMIASFFDGNVTYDGRYFSVFVSPLAYSSILLALFCIGIYLIKNIYILYVFCFFVLYSLLMTQSRSSWIAIIIYMVFCKIWERPKLTKDTIINNLVVAFLFFLLLILFKESFFYFFYKIIDLISYKLDSMLESASATQRLGSIQLVFKNLNIFTFVFGNGYGSMKELMLENFITIANFSTSDNQYITLIYDYGLLFVAVFIVFLKRILTLRFSDRYRADDESRLVVSIIICEMVSMFFYEMIEWPNISMVVYFYIGILFALRLNNNSYTIHNEKM